MSEVNGRASGRGEWRSGRRGDWARRVGGKVFGVNERGVLVKQVSGVSERGKGGRSNGVRPATNTAGVYSGKKCVKFT